MIYLIFLFQVKLKIRNKNYLLKRLTFIVIIITTNIHFLYTTTSLIFEILALYQKK